MKMPGFNADASLYRSSNLYNNLSYALTHRSSGHYRQGQSADDRNASSVLPAIPFCGNCDYILDNCEQNGWRPRAVCNACARGDCYSGVENPTPDDPFPRRPWLW